MSDRKIQGFDIETSENAGHLYVLLNAVWKGSRVITNVERNSTSPHTVYITSEKK